MTILTFSDFLIHEFWERREELPSEWTKRAQFDSGPRLADTDITDGSWYNKLNLVYWVFNESGTEAVAIIPSAVEPSTETFTPSDALLQLQTTSGHFVYLGSAVSSGLPIVAVDYDGATLVKVLWEVEGSGLGSRLSLVFDPSMSRLELMDISPGLLRGVLLCGWDWGKRIAVVAKYTFHGTVSEATGPVEIAVWDKGQFTASFSLDPSAQLPPLNHGQFSTESFSQYIADWSKNFAVDTNGHILVSLTITHPDDEGQPITNRPVNVLYAPEEQKLDTALPVFLNTTASPVGPVGLR